MAQTITAQFDVNGAPHVRRTEAAYTHASRKSNGEVRFHTSEAAARRAAGSYGQVVRTDYDPDVVVVAPPTRVEIEKAEARARVRSIRRDHGIRSDEYRAAEAAYFARYGRPQD